jgi:5-methylthioadenosine/S-adenosylhomocysteine deaminase
MLNRRLFGKLSAATALTGLAAPAFITRSFAQGAAPRVARGNYLIKNGSVITVDPVLGVLARGDVHVSNGRIVAVGPNLNTVGAETIDATDMIVMPGFIDTHYHMWSALGRNFVGDGFGYFPAKNATSKLFTAEDFYASVMLGLVELANAGITGVHNWSHNTRSPAHADAELRAHRESMLRARYAYGHIDLMPREEPVSFADVDRVKREYFSSGTAFEGLVHLGLNLRGHSQSTPPTFEIDMAGALERKLPIALHAAQTPPNWVQTEDFEKRGWLGPNLLLCHFVPARDVDAELMAKTKTPLSWATHSEFRLGRAGDPRVALLRMRKAGVIVRRKLDRAAQHVRDHALHLEHGHSLARHAVRTAAGRQLPRGDRDGDAQWREGARHRRHHRLDHRRQARRYHSHSRQRHQHRADCRHRGVGGAVGDAGECRYCAGGRPHR